MPDVAYGPLVAYDPTSNSLVRGATGTIYAVGDTTFSTPLTIKDLSGLPVQEVRSTDIGLLDEFVISSSDWVLECLWVSGPYVIRLSSYKGLLEKVDAAASNAASAATSAASSASDAAAIAAAWAGAGTGAPALTDEQFQDKVGAMFGAAYDDAAGVINIPTGGGGLAPVGSQVARTMPYSDGSNTLRWTAATAVVAQALGWIVANDFAAVPGNQPTKAELTTALAAVPVNGTLYMSGDYTWTGDLVVTTVGITITGPSAVINGRFKMGSGSARLEMGAAIHHVNFKTTQDFTANPVKGYADGSYFVGVDRARDVEISFVHFFGAAWPIYVMPNAACASHDISSLNVHDCFFSECDWAHYQVFDPAAPGGWACYADAAFNHNVINRSYVGGFYAQGVDGVNLNDNPSWFMINYGSTGNPRWQEKRQNIRIDWSDWVHINNNALFEAGHESILLDHARHVQIGGNQFAWPGQRVPSDAVKIISNSGGTYGTNAYATLSFVGNDGDRYSKSLLALVGDFLPPSLVGNGCYYVSTQDGTAAGRYQGTTETTYAQRKATLDALPHYRYDLGAVTGVTASQINIPDGVLTKADHGDRLPNHAFTTSVQSLGPFSAVGGASVTPAAFTALTSQAIINMKSAADATLTYSGLLLVTVRNTASNKESVYLLLICRTVGGVSYVLDISANGLGYVAGAAADEPSFTFSLNSGTLSATPVGSTAGTFLFSFSSLGNLIAG